MMSAQLVYCTAFACMLCGPAHRRASQCMFDRISACMSSLYVSQCPYIHMHTCMLPPRPAGAHQR